jgi:chromosome segregation ATPase
MDEEAALRRDQRGSSEREHDRDRDLAEGLTRALGEVREGVRVIEQRVANEQQRGLHHGDALAAADRERERLLELVQSTEGRVVALGESWARDRDERARFAAAIPELTSTLAELGARTASLRAELKHSEDEVAQLRTRRDREDELFELVEAQRATRARLEERITSTEERLEELSRVLGSATEERQALHRQLAGADGRIRAVAELIESQRWAVIEHFRRLVEAEEEQSRAEIEAIERRIRRGRILLMRLAEGSAEAAGEEPV